MRLPQTSSKHRSTYSHSTEKESVNDDDDDCLPDRQWIGFWTPTADALRTFCVLCHIRATVSRLCRQRRPRRRQRNFSINSLNTIDDSSFFCGFLLRPFVVRRTQFKSEADCELRSCVVLCVIVNSVCNLWLNFIFFAFTLRQRKINKQ